MLSRTFNKAVAVVSLLGALTFSNAAPAQDDVSLEETDQQNPTYVLGTEMTPHELDRFLLNTMYIEDETLVGDRMSYAMIAALNAPELAAQAADTLNYMSQQPETNERLKEAIAYWTGWLGFEYEEHSDIALDILEALVFDETLEHRQIRLLAGFKIGDIGAEHERQGNRALDIYTQIIMSTDDAELFLNSLFDISRIGTYHRIHIDRAKGMLQSIATNPTLPIEVHKKALSYINDIDQKWELEDCKDRNWLQRLRKGSCPQ